MTIRKLDIDKVGQNATTTALLCEMARTLSAIPLHARDAIGDRVATAILSVNAAIVERIESCYLPEKKKYAVEVLPNICERVEVEALDEHEAKDIACGIVDKKYPDHDGMRIHNCNEVK